MDNNLTIEEFYASFFKECHLFERKPRISGNQIFRRDEPSGNKKLNKPDFMCYLTDRAIIFEVSNLRDLVSEGSRLKLKPGTTFCYDITKQPINKINEKMQENFNNVDLDFNSPIVLLFNVDLSDVDPIQIALVLNEEMDSIIKKELISAIIICKKSFSTAILFINKCSKNKLSEKEVLVISNIFSKKGFNFANQLTQDNLIE